MKFPNQFAVRLRPSQNQHFPGNSKERERCRDFYLIQFSFLLKCSGESGNSVLISVSGTEIVSGPVLSFSSGITRSQAGTYICQASNLHGLRQGRVVVVVEHPPSCQVSVTRTTNTATTLHCRAEGSPGDFSFSWMKNNLSFTDFSRITQKENSNFGKIS